MSLKCIVTGGAGFIGSHMVDLLLKEGNSVVVLDNISGGHWQNLNHQQENPRLTIHQVDVCDYDQIKPLFVDVDWVFHFAALGDIVPSVERPMDYMHTNVSGTLSVLEASRHGGVQRFIYAASSSCYGVPDVYPTPETAPIQVEHPYALSKYLGEQMAIHWNKVYKLPVISLRFFNVYGPRVRTTGAYGAVLGIFLAQKLHRKPFTVVGDGTQSRDFVFCTDAVRACLLAAQSDIGNEAFNVGAGKPVSVNKLVQLLAGDVVHVPKRPGEPHCTHANISKISQLLGWQPRVSFEDGVGIMLDGIDEWRNAPIWNQKSIAQATRDWFRYLG